MKKTVISIILCTWFQFTCCREEANGETTPFENTDNKALIKTIKRLKSAADSKASRSYFYDSLGRLDHTDIIDLQTIGCEKITEVYFYNSAGKMIRSESPLYTNYYEYDLSNRLLQHTRVDSKGVRDSVLFSYSEEGVVGSWKNIRYYFENNQLLRVYNGNHETAAGEVKGLTAYYTYNSKKDNAAASLLKSFDVLTLSDFSLTNHWYFGVSELAFFEQKASNVSFIPQKFERSYDKDHYPVILRILAVTGTLSEEISYTYYDAY